VKEPITDLAQATIAKLNRFSIIAYAQYENDGEYYTAQVYPYGDTKLGAFVLTTKSWAELLEELKIYYDEAKVAEAHHQLWESVKMIWRFMIDGTVVCIWAVLIVALVIAAQFYMMVVK
jgi:hypothetical protein